MFKDSPSTLTVSEDTLPDQQLGVMTATDPDTFGQISYSLISDEDWNMFSIETHSGVLTLRGPLDREQRDQYKLTIRADDGVQYTDYALNIKVSKPSPSTIFSTVLNLFQFTLNIL